MAKVLVATKDRQGVRRNDFCHTTEGELVMFAMECDGEKVDGRCGCKRAFSGIDSLKATTTAKVIEMPEVHEASLTAILVDSLNKAGWTQFAGKEAVENYARTSARELLRIAACFMTGDVVEKRGSKVQTR